MPIKYRCPNCRQLLSVSRKQSGNAFPCPQCGKQTRVPLIPDPGSETPSNPRLAPVDSSPVPEQTPPREVHPGKSLPAQNSPSPAAVSHTQIVISAEQGPFKTRRSIAGDDGMDLTPMVDVTFLLLIFFMITASFNLQKTLEFPKPSAQEKGARQTVTLENVQNDSIMIKIDERNVITVDEAPLSEPSLLGERLTQLRFSTRRTSVAIDAHKEALHETVVAVIDASNAAGMENIKLISRPATK